MSVALICISCSTFAQEAQELWNNPISIPAFINNLPINIGQSIDPEYDMCLGINQSALFEPGDTAEAIYANVQETLYLTVDRQSVKTRVYSDLMLVGRYDEDSNYLGSQGGVDHVCFNLPTHNEGLYVANIEVQSTSGKIFEHRWAIRVQ